MAPFAEKPAAPVRAAGSCVASAHWVTPCGAPLADGLASAAAAAAVAAGAPDVPGAALPVGAVIAPMLARWTEVVGPLSSEPP